MILGVRSVPNNSAFDSCPRGPQPYGPGVVANQCSALHFWSPHTGGAHFAFADGSVRFLRYSADDILPALATRAGGEAVAVPD
jgi:prepilin-type processing-associated H-X9-DG protein